MKLHKSSRAVSSSVLPVSMESACLYQPQPVGTAYEVAGSPAAVEVSTEVMQALWTLGTKLTEFRLFGFLIAQRAKMSKHTIQVADVQWHSSPKPFFAGQYSIPLQYCSKPDLPHRHLSLLSSASECVTAQSKDSALPLDLQVMECCLTTDGSVALHFIRLWPAATLLLTPISPLRIVSTDLAVRLIKNKREDTKLRSGYLTMDDHRRLILLRSTSPQLQDFPVVGAWVSGLHRAKHETPATLIWATAMHYLVRTGLKRLSNDPRKHAFLMLVISAPTVFYEVTSSAEMWTLAQASLTLTGTEPGSMTVPLSFPEVPVGRQSASSSGSDGHNSCASVHSSSDSGKPGKQNSVEELVRETTSVLKSLERQLQDLKSKVGVPIPTSSPPLSARTHSRISTLMESTPAFDMGAETDRSTRRCPSLSLPYKSTASLYSLPASRRSPPKRESLMPQIEYKSESETSEDEDHRY